MKTQLEIVDTSQMTGIHFLCIQQSDSVFLNIDTIEI